ncbi:hypothetical protein D5086_007773 [Populus alba]|uniref:Uncharacterized protein n=1 Tax=Populus alba TaxID=43335 RepID=A0ACC4CF39_POPAL
MSAAAFWVWISGTIRAFPTFNAGKNVQGKEGYRNSCQEVAVEQLTASPWNNLVFMIDYEMVIDGKSVSAHLRLTTPQSCNPI